MTKGGGESCGGPIKIIYSFFSKALIGQQWMVALPKRWTSEAALSIGDLPKDVFF